MKPRIVSYNLASECPHPQTTNQMHSLVIASRFKRQSISVARYSQQTQRFFFSFATPTLPRSIVSIRLSAATLNVSIHSLEMRETPTVKCDAKCIGMQTSGDK
ncbi:MAG: hypothetical protein WBQ34_07920 [Candidatus Acidiferrales bacterium]